MASRRDIDSSDEPHVSTGLSNMIQDTNDLAALLDDQENQDFVAQSTAGETSKQKLHRLLSVRTTISSAFSFAIFQHSQRKEQVGFRKIGFGQCGLLFERPGRGYVVKVARPHFHDSLWSDFVAHFHVYKAFEQHSDLECRVPTVYSYVNKDNNQWWDEHRPLFTEQHDSFPLPSMALITERILPLPKVVREALIAQYLPPALQPAAVANPSNRECLARLYLGKRRRPGAPPAPNFTLRNFNLCLDQMLDLELPVADYAAAMGEALAVIHWQANVDAYDVEFVLGSEAGTEYTQDIATILALTPEMVTSMRPHTDLDALVSANFRRRTTRIWVLDFNLCNRWEEQMGWEQPDALVDHLVMSFFENDPYYPLPLKDYSRERNLWEAFSDSYLHKAGEILEGDGKDARLALLPGMFARACVEREQTKLDQGFGHGHRDNKDEV